MRFAPPTRQIRIIIAAFAVAAAFLWVAAFTALWTHPREGLPAVMAIAAATVTIVIAVFLIARWMRNRDTDRERELLIRAWAAEMAQATRHAGLTLVRTTAPLRRVP